MEIIPLNSRIASGYHVLTSCREGLQVRLSELCLTSINLYTQVIYL